ncbi:MAG: type IV pilus twitching motility protein PilT [Oligoflexia bacterium]|nr:type IV pilus twitching motility protein PilT [Oligoflexia bacterium]
MISLHSLLKTMVEQNSSDLHLTTASPPCLRIHGKMVRVKSPDLSSADTKQLCYSILTDNQKSKFEEHKELDLSFGIKGLARFRANLYYQRGAVAGVFRRVPYNIPSLKDLGLPPVVGELTNKKNGLVLVTGPTGSGKSTTIAALLDKINEEQYGHILTIEDPIEYLHQHKNCIVNQREVGPDTWSFKNALRYALREDPDYVLIGELRDLETVETALNIAETGHLVFATLHTNSAIQTINRMVSIFSGDQQNRIRILLSFVLQAVICQELVPAVDGKRALISEVLIPNAAVRNLIREDKLHQLYSHMQMGQNQTGMVTMNQSIMNLLVRRKVSMKAAFEASSDPEELDGLLKKAGL